MYPLRTTNFVAKVFEMLRNIEKCGFCIPSGQPTLLRQSLKCLEIYRKMKILYALWTSSFSATVFEMLGNIKKNVDYVCPLDKQLFCDSL